MAKIKVCITGSKGFIGSNLLDLLSKRDDLEVIPFVGDLLKSDDLETFFSKNRNVDQIVNLVGTFDGDFRNLLLVNAVTVENLLSVATEHKIKKIVHVSTGAVYGEPKAKVSVENDELSPNTLYGVSKMFGEKVIEYHRLSDSIDAVILRFPNVYSQNQGRGVINAFLQGIKDRGEITVRGDGKQSRNFLHVSDACRAIELAIFYDKSGTFNISNPEKISINDIVKMLQKKHQFKINHLPADNNLKDLLLDISKAKKNLGFAPAMKELQV